MQKMRRQEGGFKSEIVGQQYYRDQGLKDKLVASCSKKEQKMHRSWESGISDVPRYHPEGIPVKTEQRQEKERKRNGVEEVTETIS